MRLGKVVGQAASFVHDNPRSRCLLLVATWMSLQGCKTTDKDGSFLLDTGAPLTTETSITSTRPLDNGQSFRMGYGYDNISGQRHSSCLDPKIFSLVGRNERATDVRFSIINNKEDLANELNIKVNAEASATYGTVTGSTTAKVNILKKSNFSDHSVMGLVTLLYRAQTLELESDGDILTPSMAQLLATDPKAFRRRCGDVFTRSATTGAALYIAVNIDAKSSTISNHVETENELKAAFNNLLSVSSSASVSKDTVKTLAKFAMSMSCSSVGTSSEACAQPVMAINADDLGSIVDFLNKAKTSVSTSIDSNPNLLVSVNEVFQEYPKPEAEVDKKKFQVYFDYNPQLKVVQSLLQKEVIVNNYCGIFQYPACELVRSNLAAQIKNCAVQDDWPDCEPELVDINPLTQQAGSADRGIVVLHGFRNKSYDLTLDFNTYSGKTQKYKQETTYNLPDLQFQDMAQSYHATISPGWQLRLFEHVGGQGRCFIISATDRQDVLRYFSNIASSFRLERVQDHPEVCR